MSSERNIVLVLTQEMDLGTDPVMEELNRRGVNAIRFDTSNFPLHSTLKMYSVNGSWQGGIEYRDRFIQFDKIASIYYRRPTAFEFDSSMTPVERHFANTEARMGVGGIFRSIDAIWMNHPEKMITAEYKPLQLKIANMCGLKTPPSLITNDPDAAVNFYRQWGGDVIYKTLSSGFVVSDSGETMPIYTNRLTEEDLKHLDRVRHTACYFQKYIPKKLELRITIIGEKIFPAEIYSQHAEASATDWRSSYGDLKYGIHVLPDDIEQKCLLYMKRLGLVFGAMDMILTPDNEYVFLETNPGGQWGWIEAATGMPICKSIVDCLTGNI